MATIRFPRISGRDPTWAAAHTAAGEGPAGSHPRDEHVELAVGVAPDLLRRGAAVDLRVRRVRELVRDVAVPPLAADAAGLLHPPVPAAHRFDPHHPRAGEAGQLLAL